MWALEAISYFAVLHYVGIGGYIILCCIILCGHWGLCHTLLTMYYIMWALEAISYIFFNIKVFNILNKVNS